MPKYTVEIAFHGKEYFEGIEAESEKAAIARTYELINSEEGREADEVDHEYGYPCHTGWPVEEATRESGDD